MSPTKRRLGAAFVKQDVLYCTVWPHTRLAKTLNRNWAKRTFDRNADAARQSERFRECLQDLDAAASLRKRIDEAQSRLVVVGRGWLWLWLWLLVVEVVVIVVVLAMAMVVVLIVVVVEVEAAVAHDFFLN